jgi:Transposase DDE domain
MARKKARKQRRKRAQSNQAQHRRRRARVSNADQFRELQRWLLPNNGIFAIFRFHGNTSWLPASLVGLALCWSWSESRNVTDTFTQAVEWCGLMGNTALTTYQGFMGALVQWTDKFLSVLWPLLHRRMQEVAGGLWTVSGWVGIAFDGSRSTAPRTESNEEAFCAPNYGQGTTAKYRKKKSKGMRRRKNETSKPQPQQPQAWITMLWHMSLRLPWMWKLGPSNSSERAHVMDMLRAGIFPVNVLFCGDAGFVGYPLWAQIAGQGMHFLVRVGANVNLLTERTDCVIKRRKGYVLCWPLAAQQAKLPPLRLRLVRVRIGRQWMWMLTNVMQPSRLTPNMIVNFYKMRWGIEVEFRGLKQTLDCGKLRCRNGKRLLAELNWSIMAMVVAELFALKEQLRPAASESAANLRPDPKKRSLANTMRAIRHCLTHLKDIPEPQTDLRSRLRRAVTDSYIRKSSKRARYRPPNPDKKPLGDPEIRKLTPQEQKKLDAITSTKSVA